MFQIVKQNKVTLSETLVIDTSNEVLEFENIDEAEDLCNLFNKNSKSHYYYTRSINYKSTYNKSAIESFSDMIDVSIKYNLCAECVISALLYMKKDSTLTPFTAMGLALEDWIK
jgi:hypothetical protein